MAVGDRTVAVRLLAEVSGYVSGMNQAALAGWRVARQTETVGKSTKDSMDGAGKSAGRFGSVMAGLGGIIAIGFAAKAIGAMMDFEDAMARLGAASMATSRELESMREVALVAGRDTGHSATEAADAMTELAKAGVSTADIIGGAVSGALTLAAAGQLDVAEAAETAATAMVQFGLSGDDVTHIADLLAAGAGKAQGSVHDLGMALRQGGQVASMMGWTLEDTTTALTAFAAAGLLGSDAGTSLKTMMLRLANPSNEARDIMQQLGLSVYDAAGNMLGASEMAGALEGAFANLDPKARNAAMAIIFGTDATRAANVLFTNGQAGIEGWGVKVNDAGYAAEVAARQTDTLTGDLKRLRSTAEGLMVGSSGGGFLYGFFRSAVQAADELLQLIGKIERGLAELPDKINFNLTWDPDEGFGFEKAATKDISSWERFWIYMRTSVPNQVGLLLGAMNRAIDEGTNPFEAIGDSWRELRFDDINKGRDAVLDYIDSFKGLKPAASQASSDAGTLQGALEDIGVSAEDARDQIDDLVVAVDNLTGRFVGQQRAADAIQSAINNLFDPVNDLTAAQQDLTKANQDLTNATDDNARAKAEAAVESANLALQEATANLAIEGTTDAAISNRESMFKLRDETLKGAVELYNYTGNVDDLKGSVQLARDGLINAATAMYATHYPADVAAAKAVELADDLGLIPGDYEAIIKQYGAEQVMADADAVERRLWSLDGTTAYTYIVLKRVGDTQAAAHAARDVGWADGGWVGARGYPRGGWVSGPGGPRTDSIPAWLSNGEFVVNAHSASIYGPLLEAINNGRQTPTGLGSTTININATTETIVREIRAHERLRDLTRRQVA